MNEHTKHTLRENVYQPANRVMKTVREKPYASMAALTTIATFGIGMALLMPANRRRLATAAGMAPTGGYREMSAPESSYFEPAPRSISGSHRSYEEYAEPGPADMVKKSSPYLLGSAALLTAIYFFGRKNGRSQESGED